MMMSILANRCRQCQQLGFHPAQNWHPTAAAKQTHILRHLCHGYDAFQGQDDAQLLHNQQFTISRDTCFPNHNANKDEEALEEICCTECGAVLKKKDLLGHWRKQHQKKTKGGRRNTQRDQTRKRKPMKKRECPDCHKTVSKLQVHLRVHSGDRPYPCLHCGKGFGQKADVQRHMEAVHLKWRPFKCPQPQCEQSFAQKWDFKRHHEAVHQKQKPFDCAVCGKKFGWKFSLKQHQAFVHLKQKPFECLQCGKKFVAKGGLKRHERVHSGDKPFQCTHCPKRFSRASNQRSHEKTVHK